jgi:RNA polymerase sporulation-specific sigma factor
VYKHNDFEIISLIREGNQEALSLMFEKYTPLIYKKINQFNLMYDKEDMFQEATMLLYKSVLKFDESMNKTFTRFFELNLNRRFISIVTKRVRRQEIFYENANYIHETFHVDNERDAYQDLYKEEISKILTQTENLVYTLRELNNYSIQYIKENFDLSDKVIYNSLYRAKNKIIRHFRN